MKHKTWFRLMLEVLGVYLVATGFVDFAYNLTWLLRESSLATSTSVLPRWNRLMQFLAIGLKFGIGLYLFYGGKWIVNRAIPSDRPYCHECGYDLTGAVRERCPECDTPFDPKQVQPSRAHMGNKASDDL